MDLGTASIGAFLAVLAANYLLVGAGFARRVPALFWTLLALDVAVAVGALTFGVPGFSRWPYVRFIVGLVLLMHVAQNLQLRTRWQGELREERLADELEERRRHEDAS